MGNRSWTVVKVGGSLFDLPDLRQRLTTFLTQLDAAKVLLVPGGGATADVIRDLDRVHQLGEEASHWLAIQALSVNARFLLGLLPQAQLISQVTGDVQSLAYASGSEIRVLDAMPFFLADEARSVPLPHRWDVTSDSLAVRAAIAAKAHTLILLKSCDWSSDDWDEASRVGVVDGYFAQAVRQTPEVPRVKIVNLRA